MPLRLRHSRLIRNASTRPPYWLHHLLAAHPRPPTAAGFSSHNAARLSTTSRSPIVCDMEARREALGVEVERLRALASSQAQLFNRSERLLNIAVVGGGRMGEIRCQKVARNQATQLVAFVDVDPITAAAFASEHASCEAYVALEDAIRSQHIDAVWICAPTPSHSELIDMAAQAGLHVAVEKPVAMTAAEIKTAYDACSAHGVHLLCAFQRRSDAAYEAVARAVQDGKVGSLRSIRAVFRDHPAPHAAFFESGGGDPFHDLATHDIDYILALVKQSLPADTTYEHHPDEVWACGTSSTSKLRSAGVFDAATVVLKWKRGDVLELCATLDIARSSAYGYDQRIEVFGTSGSAISVQNLPALPTQICDGHGVHHAPRVHSFPQRFDAAFTKELDFFIDCVRGIASPKVTASDAELATVVAEAALQSARHDTVVKLRPKGHTVELEYATTG